MTFLQLHNRRQQLASQTIFGYESVYPLQSLLREIRSAG